MIRYKKIYIKLLKKSSLNINLLACSEDLKVIKSANFKLKSLVMIVNKL